MLASSILKYALKSPAWHVVLRSVTTQPRIGENRLVLASEIAPDEGLESEFDL
jgi:hypothetical protein